MGAALFDARYARGIVGEAVSGGTETGAAPSRTSKDWASVSITVSPVRSLAAASPRDLPPVDTRRRRHHSELCDASGAERKYAHNRAL